MVDLEELYSYFSVLLSSYYFTSLPSLHGQGHTVLPVENFESLETSIVLTIAVFCDQTPK